MKKTIALGILVNLGLFAQFHEHYVISHVNNNEFMIEDGSVWSVKDADCVKLQNWGNDPLSFEAEESWLGSNINCFFYNKTKKEKIEAVLTLAPESYTEKSHWVAYLEPKKSILFLDNGAIFSLYENDRSYFTNWHLDDFVIVGDYKSLLTKDKHILFNYRTKEFVFGELH